MEKNKMAAQNLQLFLYWGWISSQKSHDFGGSLVWAICNFAVNLKPNSLQTHNIFD